MSRHPDTIVRFVEVISADGEARLVHWIDVMRAPWREWPHLRLYGWRGQGEGWGWVERWVRS